MRGNMRKLYICRINTRIYGCHIEQSGRCLNLPCTQYAGSSLYAALTWSSGIQHKLVPVGIISVLYTTIEQAVSTTHSEMATIAVQTSERAKRGMQKKGNQHRNSGEKEKEKCIRRQIKV